jgi:isopentenyl-diphosphate delta-isomerase
MTAAETSSQRQNTNMADLVVLVDADDNELGVTDKLAAHTAPGDLHRAFSVFLFRSDGALLLQRRAATKYHFGGLWSNSCCGHPRPGEHVAAAAERRAREELGLRCRLSVVGSIVYRAVDAATGLGEHEHDHVLVGTCDLAPRPDETEISDTDYMSMPALADAIQHHPHEYTPWLPLAAQIAHSSHTPQPKGDFYQ